MAGRSMQYTVQDGEDTLLEDSENGDVARHKVKNEKSKYSNLLFLIVVITAISFSLTTVALAIALGVQSSNISGVINNIPSSNTSDSNMCLTPGCIQLAAQIIATMNQSADPCEHFYQFSCGNWVKDNILGQEGILSFKYGIFPDEIQQDTINVRLRKIVESGNSGGVEAVQKVLDLYKSCMDTATIESRGVQPLFELINQTGGWPLIGIPETTPWSINSSFFHYEKTHSSSALFNFQPFFDDIVMNNSRYVPYFEQPPATLLSPEANITSFKDALVKKLMLVNPSGDQSVYEAAVDNIVELDMELSKILVPPSEVPNIRESDPTMLLNDSNYYTLERLQSLWQGFDWRAFISYTYSLAGLTVPSNLRVIVTTPAYFQRLDEVLQNKNQTVIRDYAKVHFAIKYLRYLSSQFAAFRTFQDTQPGNSDSCITFVQTILPIALARPYVEQYVPEGTRENISMLADYLVQAFRERVNEMDWLSDLSKQRTIAKVDDIISMVAYPAQIMDNDYVNGLYVTYTSNASDYFGNQLRGQELIYRIRMNFTVKVDRTQWITVDLGGAPTTINAFYNGFLNNFYVMVGDLVPPLFRADWPDYFNFGGLGTIVGHEITHGFDSNGQQRDKDGIRRMWWSSESQAEFLRRQQCFINQYNKYSYLGVQVNGNRSLPENLADNGGLQTSYKAYRMRAERSGSRPQQLPSLQYTPDQLFFVAYAQVWCEIATPTYYQALSAGDPHAPSIARVNAVVNMEEFALAFKCPLGSPMNPSNDRCVIW